MIDPAEYDRFINAINTLMARARVLGMYRTGEQLHHALNEARAEVYEARPANIPTVTWHIGPVGEEPTP